MPNDAEPLIVVASRDDLTAVMDLLLAARRVFCAKAGDLLLGIVTLMETDPQLDLRL